MKYSASYDEIFELDDGVTIQLRAIRAEDKSGLLEAFGQLSEESRRRRFLTPKKGLSEKELRYFTECDGVNHYAIVAIVASAVDGSPEGIGVVRFVRAKDDPQAAELAIVVVDAWHRRGVGRRLLEKIVAAAAERGIVKIRATALAENEQIRGLLEQYQDGIEIGPSRRGVLEFRLAVPPVSRLEPMITLLRKVALPGRSEDDL